MLYIERDESRRSDERKISVFLSPFSKIVN